MYNKIGGDTDPLALPVADGGQHPLLPRRTLSAVGHPERTWSARPTYIYIVYSSIENVPQNYRPRGM